MAQRAALRADVEAIAPALVAATDDQMNTALEVTAHLVAPRRWRSLASTAHAYLAAHWLATTPGLGLDGGEDFEDVLGPTSAMADGPASRSFGQVASTEAVPASDADYLRTPYGRQFLALRRQQRGFGSFMVSGGGAGYPA